jgi:hypothetical protein
MITLQPFEKQSHKKPFAILYYHCHEKKTVSLIESDLLQMWRRNSGYYGFDLTSTY